jgi:hypothetical protein
MVDDGGVGLAGAEETEAVGEHGGIGDRAVAGDQSVAELVDQAHSEERAGVQDGARLAAGLARLVRLAGELAGRRKIGEDGVACVVEEQVVNVKFGTYCPRNVKFHSCASVNLGGDWVGCRRDSRNRRSMATYPGPLQDT